MRPLFFVYFFLLCLLPLCLSAKILKNLFKTKSLPKTVSQDLELNDLSPEILNEILIRLPKKDRTSFKSINRKFWSVFDESKDVLNEFLKSNSHGVMSVEKVEVAVRKLIRTNVESSPSPLNITNLRTCLSDNYLYPSLISFSKKELNSFFTEPPSAGEIKISNSSILEGSSGMFVYMEVRRKKLPFFLRLSAQNHIQSYMSITPRRLHPSHSKYSQSSIPIFNSHSKLSPGEGSQMDSRRALSGTEWYEKRNYFSLLLPFFQLNFPIFFFLTPLPIIIYLNISSYYHLVFVSHLSPAHSMALLEAKSKSDSSQTLTISFLPSSP